MDREGLARDRRTLRVDRKGLAGIGALFGRLSVLLGGLALP
jgi:hypothetical protein